MNLGLELVAENLGFSFSDVVWIVFLFGGIIFLARDVRLGMIMGFVVQSVLAMWFFSQGWNYYPSLTLGIMFFAGLALSMFFDKGAVAGVV